MQYQEVTWSDSAVSAYDVVDGEFIVVTADEADLQPYAPLSALLRRVRAAFGLDAVFVAEWACGDPVVRSSRPQRHGGDTPAPTLQVMYGMSLLDGRLAAEGSLFHAAPVITEDGLQHGTLCCRLPAEHGEQPEALRSVARLIAKWFDQAELGVSGLMPLHSHSKMGGLSGLMPLRG